MGVVYGAERGSGFGSVDGGGKKRSVKCWLEAVALEKERDDEEKEEEVGRVRARPIAVVSPRASGRRRRWMDVGWWMDGSSVREAELAVDLEMGVL